MPERTVLSPNHERLMTTERMNSGEEQAIQPTSLPLTWVHHPARHEPLRLAVFTFVLILTVAGLALLEPGSAFPAVAAAVLVAAASPFLFPTRYTLLEEGIRIRSLLARRSRRWEELRRWQADRNGILVSPFRAPSALDDLRGLYLRQPPPTVKAILQARLGNPIPLSASTPPPPGASP